MAAERIPGQFQKPACARGCESLKGFAQGNSPLTPEALTDEVPFGSVGESKVVVSEMG